MSWSGQSLHQGWNVTQFARRVAGERAVNRNVIVRTGRVIRRMATVLVAGDLLAQNVKSPALKDITALTVYKSARDVTQVRFIICSNHHPNNPTIRSI